MNQSTAAKKSVHFKAVRKIDGSCFYLDTVNKISCVSWKGVVKEDTARELLTLGADSVEFQGYGKLLLDRRNLIEFDTAARVWIKHDLLKSRARKIVGGVEKLAYVHSKNSRGSVFSNFISAGIRMIFPNLTMKKFDDLKSAVSWLIRD